MTTDFNGQPVFGGTYPALIWHDFMLSAMQAERDRAARLKERKATKGTAQPGEQAQGGEVQRGLPTPSAKARSGSGAESSTPSPPEGSHHTGEPHVPAPSPSPPARAPEPAPTPAPSATPSPAPATTKGTEGTGGVSPAG
jgi:hypothetical protein